MRTNLVTGKISLELKEQRFEINSRERSSYDFLVVEPDLEDRDHIKNALSHNGYSHSYQATDSIQALKILQGRNFTHCIFSTKATNMPIDDFVSQALEMSQDLIAIPASSNPNADDVFELLQCGARGFLVKPFTSASIELGILMATKGDPLSEAVLFARNRNEAFSALMAANLDKLATAMRQAKQYETAGREIEQLKSNLINSAEMGKMFAKGGEDSLLESLTDFFCSLGAGPASRLGRLRHRLRKKRGGPELNSPDSESPAQ